MQTLTTDEPIFTGDFREPAYYIPSKIAQLEKVLCMTIYIHTYTYIHNTYITGETRPRPSSIDLLGKILKNGCWSYTVTETDIQKLVSENFINLHVFLACLIWVSSKGQALQSQLTEVKGCLAITLRRQV